MNDTRWEENRKAYIAYRATKRRFRGTLKVHNRTYNRLERSFEKYMTAHSVALNNLDDETQPDKLSRALRDFQNAKKAHDQSRHEFSTFFKEFQAAELSYSVVIFKGLRGVYKLTIANLSSVFGIWSSRISEWTRANNQKDLTDAYEKEFGSLEDDSDLDE